MFRIQSPRFQLAEHRGQCPHPRMAKHGRNRDLAVFSFCNGRWSWKALRTTHAKDHILTGRYFFIRKEDGCLTAKQYICPLHIAIVNSSHHCQTVQFPKIRDLSEYSPGPLTHHVISLKKLPCAESFVFFWFLYHMLLWRPAWFPGLDTGLKTWERRMSWPVTIIPSIYSIMSWLIPASIPPAVCLQRHLSTPFLCSECLTM